jgi:hypothetical protein
VTVVHFIFPRLSDGSLLSKLLKAIVVLFAFLHKKVLETSVPQRTIVNNPHTHAKDSLKRTDQ